MNLIFFGDYKKSGVGTAPSSAPTITIYSVNRSSSAEASVVSGGTTTASSLTGRYFYVLSSADLQTYDYHARFHTTDSTVDSQDLDALWTRWSEAVTVDSGGDVSVSGVTFPSTVPSAAAIAAAVMDDVSDTVGADVVALGTAVTAVYNRIGAPTGASIAADIQTRSTYAGGAVASVTAAVNINLAQTGLSPRDLGSVADSSLTVGDGIVCAIAAAAGKESVSGTTYTVETPFTGTTIRSFTLDSGSAPTQRS